MASYGTDGTCGWQHNNTVCLPLQQRSCCSANGYCGSNETYCFVQYGCQLGCVDPSAFNLSITPTSAPAATVTATTAAPPAPAPALNSQQKTGIIVGVILFALAVIIILLIWLHRRRQTQPAVTDQLIRFSRTEANGTRTTFEAPVSAARQFPIAQIMGATVARPAQRRFLGIGSVGSSARYNVNGDDDRFQDLDSERG